MVRFGNVCKGDYRMKQQMLACLMLGGLFAIPMCGAQSAANPLSQEDYKLIASLGISLDSNMVTELTPVDRDKLKQIIKEKPAAEVKSFLVSRYFVRKTTAASPKPPNLDAAEIAAIRQDFYFHYCYNFSEKMDFLTNVIVYYGIHLSDNQMNP